jgi:DNA-binding response OmpR family regulator
MSTILAIGLEPAASTFLEGKGFLLASEKSCSKDHLCALTAFGAHELVLLGRESRLGPGAVKRLRQRSITVPAIQVIEGPRNRPWSLRCAEFLDAGGDDVLATPTRPEELAYAMSSVLRRAVLEHAKEYHFQHEGQELEINIRSTQVRANGRLIKLTCYETRLLLALAHCRGIASRKLLTRALGTDPFNTNIVDVLICRIRRKLRSASPLLVTRHGEGYELLGRIL